MIRNHPETPKQDFISKSLKTQDPCNRSGFRKARVLLLFCALLLLSSTPWLPFKVHGDAVVASIPVGSNPFGLSVNPSSHLVYAVAGGGIMIINGTINAVKTTIPNIPGTYVAVNPTTGHIFVTSASTNMVYVIDGSSNKIIQTISVPNAPWQIAVNSVTNTVFVEEDSLAAIAIIPDNTYTYTTTTLSGLCYTGPGLTNPSTTNCFSAGIDVDTSTNKIYAAFAPGRSGFNTAQTTISVIDGVTDTVTTTVTYPGMINGGANQGVAVNSMTHMIYATLFNSVEVINGLTNSLVTSTPVGNGPFGVATYAATNETYTANFYDDTVSIIVGKTSAVAQTVSVGPSGNVNEPWALAVDPTLCHVYVSERLSGTVVTLRAAGCIITQVLDDATNVPPLGNEKPGTSFHDTATVIAAGDPAAVPSGSVTYNFFTNAGCTGLAARTQAVTITSAGTVPNSVSTGPLRVGSYSFNATYSGDGNYIGSSSRCEPFSVGSTLTTTEVLNGAGSNVTNTEVPLGTTVSDNATVQVNSYWGGPFPGPCPVNPSGPPNSLPCISIVPASNTPPLTGGTFVLNVNFTNMPSFAGWFISIKTDPRVLNPTKVTIGATLSSKVTGFSNCVDGATSGCSMNDGGGVVTSAFGSIPCICVSGNGTLFSITYNVTQANRQWGITPATTNVDYVPSYLFSEVFDAGGGVIINCSVTPDQCLTTSISVITGTVTYNFFANGSCAGSPLASGTVAVGSLSSPEGPLSAGSYSFNAVYGGDANYPTSTSSCEPFSVSKGIANVSTAVFDVATLSPWSGTETIPSAAYDVATVTGVSGFTPTGTFLYTFYTNGICSGTGIASDNVTLTKTAAVPISESEGQWIGGPYSFQGNYSGDSNYAPSTSSCETFNTKDVPSVATVIMDSSGKPVTFTVIGNPVHDTAALSGATSNAGGSVNYSLFSNGGCSGSPLIMETDSMANGVSQSSGMGTPGLSVGSYSFDAVYGGDPNNSGATSPCEQFTVVSIASVSIATVIVSNSGMPVTSVVMGNPVHDTATLSGATSSAGGQVTYNLFSNGGCSGAPLTSENDPVNNGVVSPSSGMGTAGLSPGSYSFDAVYNGDSNNTGATSPCEQFRVTGSSLSATATVVYDASTNAPWSGSEMIGASAYDTATVSTSGANNPVHDSATLSGVTSNAGGHVTYNLFSNGGCSGAPLTSENDPVTNAVVSQSSNMGTSGLSPGSYSFDAVYSGDSSNNGATSPCEQFTVVSTASVSVATIIVNNSGMPVSSAVVGNPVHDTAILSGVTSNAGGHVTYNLFSNGACSGTLLASENDPVTNGVAPQSSGMGTAGLSVGSYSFNSVYGGDPNNSGATSPCEPFSVVSSASVSIATIIRNSSGSPVSSTATSIPPGGTVTYTFYFNSGCSGAGSAAGTVSLTSSGAVPNSGTEGPLAAGSYSFRAVYSGDNNYAASTGPCESLNVSSQGTVGVPIVPVNTLVVLTPLLLIAFLVIATTTGSILFVQRRKRS